MPSKATKPIRIQHLEDSWEFLLEIKKSNKAVFLKLWKNFKKAEIPNNGLGGDCFGKLKGEIWYFRVNENGIWYRTLCFWDKTEKKHTLVVCTHTILKKGNKVPPNEIENADKMRKIYFENKEDG